MQRYILVRFLQSLLAIWVMSIIVFSLARFTGDPLDVLLPMEAGEGERERVAKHWGLDKPLFINLEAPLDTQYFVFLGKALRGDFGTSWKWQGHTAMGLVLERLPATLELAGLAIAISVILALPFGVLTAVWRDSLFDSVGKRFALLGQSLPTFWLGIVLRWTFAVRLGWFQVATMMRLIRSSMLDVLDSEFVKLTRVKGLPEWKVVWKHCLRNAAIAPLTYFAITAGVLITGSVIIESVFAWPGTGLLAVDAVRARDFQVVQAIVIVFAAVFILTNLVVDILYAYIDPRIRYQ